MVRSVGAVLGGYLVMIVFLAAGLVTIYLSFPDYFPPPAEFGQAPYTGPSWVLVFEIVWGIPAAFVGGTVCARIAGRHELTHGLVVAGIMLVLGLLTFLGEQGLKPAWSILGATAVGPPSFVLGTWLQQRRREGAAGDPAAAPAEATA